MESILVLPLMAYCVDPPMLITDLMEQGDIRKYLSSRGWDQKLGLKLLLDVATGMTYLHSKGILHGDLKTVNVMVDNDQALIADFGLSKIKSEATRGTSSTAFAGTPGFVAPELIEGEGLQAPADVFSFAMVCYEVVSRGKMPYQGEANIAALLYKVAVEHARPPRPDGVSDDVWWLIERCWAHDPRERPTFVEIREELQRIVQGQAV